MMLCNVNDKTLRDDNRFKTHIPNDKVHLFKKLFNGVKDVVGGYDKAINVIGLSNGVMDKMNKGVLSSDMARKIMLAHRKYCK